jgi:hypothetical protein
VSRVKLGLGVAVNSCLGCVDAQGIDCSACFYLYAAVSGVLMLSGLTVFGWSACFYLYTGVSGIYL